MAESAALVPIPFYAPVRTGTGTLSKDARCSSSGRCGRLHPNRTTSSLTAEKVVWSLIGISALG